MTHDHDHRGHDHGDTGHIGVAFLLNFSFALIEVAGGLLTNSIAILSDALHDLGDSLALALAWYLQKVSDRGRDRRYTYGYKRFSLLGALAGSGILIVGSVVIVFAAIPRLIEPQPTVTWGMLLLAVLGIVVNGAAVLRLKKGTSQNAKVVALHLLEDVLGWGAVLVGAVVIHFTGWYWIDPLLSLGIAAFILITALGALRSSAKILLQGIPEEVDLAAIEARLTAVAGVASSHDLHLWSLDGERTILTVHLVLDAPVTPETACRVKRETAVAMEELGVGHCTIELEGPDEPCARCCS
ncbi:MAG TPA: cation diffusion facilitator family transporter [bacterium]|nr:cation diffusion facilitator family transporter [bacterium]